MPHRFWIELTSGCHSVSFFVKNWALSLTLLKWLYYIYCVYFYTNKKRKENAYDSRNYNVSYLFIDLRLSSCDGFYFCKKSSDRWRLSPPYFLRVGSSTRLFAFRLCNRYRSNLWRLSDIDKWSFSIKQRRHEPQRISSFVNLWLREGSKQKRANERLLIDGFSIRIC